MKIHVASSNLTCLCFPPPLLPSFSHPQQRSMQLYRRWCKGMVPLLLFCILCSSRLVLVRSDGAARDVSNLDGLLEALQTAAVTAVTVTEDLKLNNTEWKDAITVGRDVTITGGGSRLRLLDFNGVAEKIILKPGVTLTFQSISLNETVVSPPAYTPVLFSTPLQMSPNSTVLFKDAVVYYSGFCPDVRASGNDIFNYFKGFERPKNCISSGKQTVGFKRLCNLEQCWPKSIWFTDFCSDLKVLPMPNGPKSGGHREEISSSYMVCSRPYAPYPCKRTSQDQPECPPPTNNASSTPSPSPSPAASAATNSKSKGSNMGVIAAAVAVPLVLLILAALLFVFRRKLPCCKGSARGAGALDKESMPVTQPLAKSPMSGGHDRSREHHSSQQGASAGSLSTGGSSHQMGPAGTKGMGITTYGMSTTDDKVELSTLLGRGSFGSVFKGRWRNMDVAVKILQHESHQLQQIQSEAHLNTCLRHANVASALQIIHKRLGSTPKPPSDIQDLHDQSSSVDIQSSATVVDMMETWIMMELCDQGSLENLFKKKAFIKDGKLFMYPLLLRLRDVAAGMTYIHGKNICHGDLKAGNVLVATSENDPFRCNAKIADFGLSRVLVSAQSHLSTRTMGTPSRMPPELLLKGQLSPAGDVYAFGILLYEAASGQLPFKNMAIGELIHKVVMNHERPAMPPYVPKQYAELAMACWAPDRELRPTFKSVLQCVESMLANVEGLQREVDSFDYEAFAAAKAQASGGGVPRTTTGAGTAPTRPTSSSVHTSTGGLTGFSAP